MGTSRYAGREGGAIAARPASSTAPCRCSAAASFSECFTTGANIAAWSEAS